MGDNTKLIAVHDDGPCADGSKDTPLVNGYCQACGYSPDLQSISFLRVPTTPTKITK